MTEEYDENGGNVDHDENGESAEPLGDLARRLRARRESRDDKGRSASERRMEWERNESAERTGEDHEQADFDFDVGREGEGAGSGDGADSGDSLAHDESTTEADDLFEAQEVGEIDTEQVWESVLGDDEEAQPESLTSEIDDRVKPSDDDTEHIVPKRAYCESCAFFDEPPTVACTYEGASILEVVDSSEFRVRNCPVVAGEIDTRGHSLDGSGPMSSVGDTE